MLKILTFLCLFLAVLKASPGISLASNYQKNSALQWQWATESLRNFSFRPTDHVLDVGSGDGKMTALIADQIPEGQIIGIDISDKMVQHASHLHRRKNLQFIQGDVAALPFQECFDKVVSFCTMHWILDQERALIPLRNSLKPQGEMLIVVPGKSCNNLGPHAELLVQSEKWAPYFPHFQKTRIYFSHEEYADLIRKCHFEIRSITATPSTTLYPNRAAFIEWLIPLVNFIDHLPTHLHSAFIEDLAQQMLSTMTFLPNGTISMQDIKLEIVAVKL